MLEKKEVVKNEFCQMNTDAKKLGCATINLNINYIAISTFIIKTMQP